MATGANDDEGVSDDLDTVMSEPGAYNFDDPPGTPAPPAPRPIPTQPAPRPTPVPSQLVTRSTPAGTQPTPLSAPPRDTPLVSVAPAPRMSQRRPAVHVDADVEPPPRRKSRTLLPDDIVPQFHSGTLNRTLSGGYEVTNPNSGQTFALNEFEVSLARMLNGRRQVSEILEAGNRLEIPITLDSLQKFIHELEECGFLGGTSAAPQTETRTWPARGEWDSAVRSFFQSGVRLLRMGKHAEAATCFEAILEEDPANVEARELLAVARQHGSVGLGHAPAMVSLPITGTAPQLRDPRRNLLLVSIGAVVLLCVALVYLFTRDNHDTTSKQPVVKLEPDATPKPDPVKPNPVKVYAAKPVPTKPDLTKPNPTKPEATKPEATKPEATKPDTTKPDPALPAIQVEAPTGGEVTAYLRGPRTVMKGERLFKISYIVGDPAKIKQATAKLADLEKLAKQDHATYDAFVADARKNLASVRKISSTVVTAPRAGKAEPKVKPNSTIRPGQVMAVIQ